MAKHPVTRSLFTMTAPNVLVHATDIDEAVSTQVASIQPFPCVLAHVVLKAIGPGKGLVTLAAGESLHFSCMFIETCFISRVGE